MFSCFSDTQKQRSRARDTLPLVVVVVVVVFSLFLMTVLFDSPIKERYQRKIKDVVNA